MKKHIKIVLVLAITISLIASCKKDDDAEVVDPYEICSAKVETYEYTYLTDTEQAINSTSNLGIDWDALSTQQKNDVVALYTTKNYTDVGFRINETQALENVRYDGEKKYTIGQCVSANEVLP